ncbi:MAG: site-specific integrase [Methanoregula sp.]
MSRDKPVASAFNLVRPEYADNSINAAIAKGRLTQQDADLIKAFCAEMQATNDISIQRVNKLTFTLVSLRRFVGEYSKNTITDLHKAIPTIKNAVNEKGKPYKQNTIVDFIKILKQFYTWAIINNHSSIPLEKVRAIKNPSKDAMTKTAADLITPDELSRFIQACLSDRDRALFMMLYEGGFRIGELGTLTWSQVKFDDYGVVVNVNFKTNKPRYVRLIMSVGYLAKWKSIYPEVPEGSALVFLTKRDKPLTHGSVSRSIDRIIIRAGIERHITSHFFRHTRVTDLMKQGMAQSVISQIMWGSVDSRMFKTYLHLTGLDVDNEVLRLYGIEPQKKAKEQQMTPKQCPHCQTVNPPFSGYCYVCGHQLTDDAAAQFTTLRRISEDKPEIMLRLAQERMAQNQMQVPT